MEEKVLNAIRSRALLKDGQSLLVSVSGGLDSMVLLELLHRLGASHSWRLAVAHFNHRLRGPDSARDEQFVREQAKIRALPYYSSSGDVKHTAETHSLSIEMAARKLRHEFLATQAATLDVETVALAHHADDQVETFWLRALRGSAGDGLAGMAWSNPSPVDPQVLLIRPLLGSSKAELRKFATAASVPFREDATNAQTDFQRNKVRNELVPFLIREFQPALLQTTLRLAEVLSAEKDYLNRNAREWLREPEPSFDSLHVALQRVILHQQLIELELTPDYDLIEQLRLEPGKPVCVEPERRVARDLSGKLRVERLTANEFCGDSMAVKLTSSGGMTWNGVTLAWRIQEKPPGENAANSEVFDADEVGPEILLRHWRAGDRFQPIGMAESVKLQDIFTNLKIPAQKRRDLLVAAVRDGRIFWVESLRMSEAFKITPRTRRFLVWEWNRVKEPATKAS